MQLISQKKYTDIDYKGLKIEVELNEDNYGFQWVGT